MIARTAGFFGVLTALLGLPAPALAATVIPGSTPGIAITPAIQDRALGQTEKSTAFVVQLANETDKPLRFALSSKDFKALNQTGGLAFLGTDAQRTTSDHGLSGILRFDAPQVTVPAHSSLPVTARITDVSKLAGGGHYAAIVAQAIPDSAENGGNRVSINQAVSSLVFLETAGQGSKTLTLLKPEIPGIAFSLPSAVNVVFKATGNTQTVPRGLVRTLHGDSEQQRGIINENSSLILPGSTRLLPIQLKGNAHPWLPGTYTLRVQYRYEGSLGISSYEKQFLYINIGALLVLIIGIVALIYGAFISRSWLQRFYRKNPMPDATKRVVKVRDISHEATNIVVAKISKK